MLILRNILLFIVYISASLSVAGPTTDIEWTKNQTAVVKPFSPDSKEGQSATMGEGMVSFILGEGMVSLFPNATDKQILDNQDTQFSVHDRFSILVSLADRIGLRSEERQAGQRVPTAELLGLAKRFLSRKITLQQAKNRFSSLTAAYADHYQYRVEN